MFRVFRPHRDTPLTGPRSGRERGCATHQGVRYAVRYAQEGHDLHRQSVRYVRYAIRDVPVPVLNRVAHVAQPGHE